MAKGAGAVEVAHHDGERLVGAALAAAEFEHRGLVGGVAGEVEAAQALDGDDAPCGDEFAAALDDGVAFLAGAPDGGDWPGVGRGAGLRIALAPRDVRAALKAGIRLGVEAPVERIGVFGGAGGAHGEAVHGGHGAVIGQVADDGEARSAVGAVDEGVVVAPVCGVEELADAVRAGGDVGRDQRCVRCLIL